MHMPGKVIGGADLADALRVHAIENTRETVLHSARFRFGTGLALCMGVSVVGQTIRGA